MQEEWSLILIGDSNTQKYMPWPRTEFVSFTWHSSPCFWWMTALMVTYIPTNICISCASVMKLANGVTRLRNFVEVIAKYLYFKILKRGTIFCHGVTRRPPLESVTYDPCVETINNGEISTRRQSDAHSTCHASPPSTSAKESRWSRLSPPWEELLNEHQWNVPNWSHRTTDLDRHPSPRPEKSSLGCGHHPQPQYVWDHGKQLRHLASNPTSQKLYALCLTLSQKPCGLRPMIQMPCVATSLKILCALCTTMRTVCVATAEHLYVWNSSYLQRAWKRARNNWNTWPYQELN